MRSLTGVLLLVFARQVQVQTVARAAMPRWQSLPNLPPAHKLPSNQHLNQPLLNPLPSISNPRSSLSLKDTLNFNPLQNLFPQSRGSPLHSEALRLPRKQRNLVKVYGIDHEYDECRQATIPASYEALFVSVASLRRGSCHSQGFVDAVATETFNVPFLGNIPIKVLKKAAAGSSATPDLPRPTIETYTIQSYPEIISISAVLLSSLFAGSVVTFAMLRFRSSISTLVEEPLLGACI